MSMLNMAVGVLGLLGRARGGARRPAPEDDGAGQELTSDGRPTNGYAVPLSRADTLDDDTTRQLDATMNYSPDPRTGRIPKGVYRGKTPPEARLAARREVERRSRDIGGGSAARSTDAGPDAAAREARARAGREARDVSLARARDDRRGMSVWRNNGDGTATTGGYGPDNRFSGARRDIVPRLSPGQVTTVKPDQPVPKGATDDTHMVYEGTKDGTVVAKAMPTITPQGTITVLGKDGRMRSTNVNDPVPTNAPLVAKAPLVSAAPPPAARAEEESRKTAWARPLRVGPRARA